MTDVKRAASAVAILAVIGGAVVIGGVVAGIGVLRAMRRARSAVLRGQPTPTASDDVWSRHVPPELDEFEDETDSGSKDRF